jgi:uridylate kinase
MKKKLKSSGKNSGHVVIALGGSMIVKDEIRTDYLPKFKRFILDEMKKGNKFVIVTGGGKLCRRYNEAACAITHVPDKDLDWLGIHVTRLNGQLLRTIFWREAYRIVLDNCDHPVRGNAKLIIAAGTRPGWSTDYVSVKLAKRFNSKRVIVAGTYDGVYDKDFEKFGDAKRFDVLDWKTYRGLIASDWKPGYRAPVDPVAAKFADKYHVRVDIVEAEDFGNFGKCIAGEKFDGTTIN